MANFVDVFDDVTKEGHKIPKESYLPKGLYPIIDQGQEYIAGYTNDASGLYCKVPVIIFGDHTRIIKYVDTPCFLGADGVKLLRAKIPDANYKYLYYALCNARIPDTGYNRHFKWLKEIDIPMPIPTQQEHIVSVLDKINNLIDLRKQQLDKLDELVKARFVEMFGDPILNSKCFETIRGHDFFKLSNGKTVSDERRTTSGIPAYGGNGISWYTDQALYDNDTLVIGRVGFQSGNVHLAKGPLWVTDNAMYISDFFVSEYNLVFLYALMEHIDFTRYQDAGDLKKITQKPFMQMEFIFPPLELQNRYSTFVAQVEKIKLTIQRGLDKLEMMKKALMQKYFR